MALLLRKYQKKQNKNKKQPKKFAEKRLLKELDKFKMNNVDLIINDENIMNFDMQITFTDGLWKGAIYTFNFNISDEYPILAPKVVCISPNVYHPNISLKGSVCLNILKDEWSPALSIEAIAQALLFLFNEPNPNDPENLEAAKIMRENPNQFKKLVKQSLKSK